MHTMRCFALAAFSRSGWAMQGSHNQPWPPNVNSKDPLLRAYAAMHAGMNVLRDVHEELPPELIGTHKRFGFPHQNVTVHRLRHDQREWLEPRDKHNYYLAFYHDKTALGTCPLSLVRDGEDNLFLMYNDQCQDNRVDNSYSRYQRVYTRTWLGMIDGVFSIRWYCWDDHTQQPVGDTWGNVAAPKSLQQTWNNGIFDRYDQHETKLERQRVDNIQTDSDWQQGIKPGDSLWPKDHPTTFRTAPTSPKTNYEPDMKRAEAKMRLYGHTKLPNGDAPWLDEYSGLPGNQARQSNLAYLQKKVCDIQLRRGEWNQQGDMTVS